MKRNKGGVSFVKEATKRGFLIEKRKGQGAKNKSAIFFLPLPREAERGEGGGGGVRRP